MTLPILFFATENYNVHRRLRYPCRYRRYINHRRSISQRLHISNDRIKAVLNTALMGGLAGIGAMYLMSGVNTETIITGDPLVIFFIFLVEDLPQWNTQQ